MCAPELLACARASLRRLRESGQLPPAEADVLDLGLALVAQKEPRPSEGHKHPRLGTDIDEPSSEEGWAELPNGLLTAAARAGGLWDSSRARLVCRRWRRVFPLAVREDSWLGFRRPVGNAVWWADTVCRMLSPDRTAICLEPYADSMSGLVQSLYVTEVVKRMPGLVELKLRVAGLTEEAMDALGGLTGLTRLEVDDLRCHTCPPVPSGKLANLSSVAMLTQLRALRLHHGCFAGLLHDLTRLTGLRELILDSYDLLDGEFDTVLCSLTALTTLKFQHPRAEEGLDTGFLEILPMAPHLQVLQLPDIDDAHANGWSQPLLHLTALRELNLQSWSMPQDEQHEELWETLRNMTRLTSLTLGSVLGQGFSRCLEALQGLEVLDLRSCSDLQEEHFQPMPLLTRLQRLHLPEGCEDLEVTETMMQRLPGQLRHLSVMLWSLEDGGLLVLPRLTGLKQLQLRVWEGEGVVAATMLPTSLESVQLGGIDTLGQSARYFGLHRIRRLQLTSPLLPNQLQHLPRGLQELELGHVLGHPGTDFSRLPPDLKLLGLQGRKKPPTMAYPEAFSTIDLEAIVQAAPGLRTLLLSDVCDQKTPAESGVFSLCQLKLLERVAVYNHWGHLPDEDRLSSRSLALLTEIHPNGPTVRILELKASFDALAESFAGSYI